MKLCSLLAAGMALCISVCARGETRVVSPAGDDSNPGTAAQPWRTLQKAADAVVPGDRVLVQAGNYAGFQLSTSGTALQRITFEAEAGAIINAPKPIGFHRDGIAILNASYITIQGFTLVGTNDPATSRAGISIVGDGDNAGGNFSTGVVIRNNRADQWGRWGIFTGFAEDLLIENNETSRSVAEHGIYFSNSADRPTIRNNISWGNHANGIHINSDIFTGNTELARIDGIIKDAVVERNVVFGNGVGGGSGINADGVQESFFENNLLYDNHASGISLYKIDGAEGAKNNVVSNNTIVNAADGRWALNIVDGSTGNTVFNNIFWSLHPSRGAVTISADSLAGLKSNYNLVESRFENDGNFQNLAEWQSATGQDGQSAAVTQGELEALFSNYAGRDFTLAAGSAAIDAGVGALAGRSAPSSDLAGKLRAAGVRFDVGAYEFGAAAGEESLVWKGAVNGLADIATTANWNNGVHRTHFRNGSRITFDDTLAGTANLTLVETLVPESMVFNNALTDYTLAGPGSIGGAADLFKAGGAALRLETANTFTGGVALSLGVLQVGHDGALGTGQLIVLGGRLEAVKGPRRIGNPVQVLGDFSVGGGAPITLDGGQTWTGARTMTVQEGVLRYDLDGGDAVSINPGNRIVVGATAALELAGSKSALSAVGTRIDVVNQGELRVLGTNQEAGAILGGGKTTVGANAQLSAGRIRQAELTLGGSGASAVVRPNGGPTGLVVLNALEIVPGARLDLNDNDLVVQYGGASPLGEIRQWIVDGFLGTAGAPQIASSAGQVADPPITFLVAFANNSSNGASEWLGETFPANSDQVIVKYTYFGDLNLDGMVDAQDYLVIDNNFGQGTDWLTGDANLDGQVNAQDYVVIDNAFGRGEGNPLAAGGAFAVSSAVLSPAVLWPAVGPVTVAVPEPGSWGLMALAAAAASLFWGRRVCRASI